MLNYNMFLKQENNQIIAWLPKRSRAFFSLINLGGINNDTKWKQNIFGK